MNDRFCWIADVADGWLVGEYHQSGPAMCFETSVELNDFSAMIRLTPLVHVQVIRRGVCAVGGKDIVRMMAALRDKVFNILKLSITSVNRKANPDQKLPPEDGERIVGVANLIGQVQTMVEQSGATAGFEFAGLLASGPESAVIESIQKSIHFSIHSWPDSL
jgi:hypothetical protein